jgi:hypothetical protein
MNEEMSGQHIFLTENLTATQQHHFHVIKDPLRQDRRESQCKVYFFHHIRLLKALPKAGTVPYFWR